MIELNATSSDPLTDQRENAELLASIERKDNSVSLLSELNEHGVSPRRATKKANQWLKLSNIRSVDEGDESPLGRHKALNKSLESR